MSKIDPRSRYTSAWSKMAPKHRTNGYVHLPPRADDAHPHPSNLFFYYAKSAEKRTTPLTIYLGGGPGASSMSSMATEVGPCSVNSDSNSTSPNPWSWTRESDIFFIDQPVQTGFSYDVLTNATIDYSTSTITPTDFDDGVPISSPSPITIDTLSIHNGCSDITTQGAFYPEYAYNNTYGVQAITETQYEEAKYNWTKPGGCLDMAVQCQELVQKLDPYNFGNNAEVNDVCFAADEYCYENVLAVYALSGVSSSIWSDERVLTVVARYP
ncbi:unnamed protein product [Aspergillus oryzae var. brunneus]|uniref:Unnamed protein product n=1 Tax=Aspergillus oryzae var. brunneus TaxID=332754 RepID=A0ABQ6KEQ3_ASPOZ|nr:unnamed protein product [Aspergillus oryzae var. brunneus]